MLPQDRILGLGLGRGVLSQNGERFPKRARLTRRSEFLSLSRGGKKVHTFHFIVIIKANDKGENRLGVTVSTRVGKAVVRNRIKRLLREFFRCHRKELPSYEDILIIAKKGAGELSLNEVTSELSKAFADPGSRQGSGSVL